MDFYGVICHYKNMKKINDPKKLNYFLTKFKIPSFFLSPHLPFTLYTLERGEILNHQLDPAHYLIFTVSGTLRISYIREDGSSSDITTGSSFSCLGDVEFASGTSSPYIIEVVRRTTCVALYIDPIKDSLQNDPVFLNYLLKSVSEKLNRATAMSVEPKDLRERLLHYIRTECVNHQLTGVEKTAGILHCSKRQLLRHLKTLCEQKVLIHTGKGEYTLSDEITAH